jgi:hypothetical protein
MVIQQKYSVSAKRLSIQQQLNRYGYSKTAVALPVPLPAITGARSKTFRHISRKVATKRLRSSVKAG